MKIVKNNENFNVFCWFSAKSDSKLFHPDQENERQDIYSNGKKKYFCQTFTDNARHKNVPPPLDLTRIFKSYHKTNDRIKFLEK